MNKPTLEDWLKKQEDFYENHVGYHPANAFCGTAGEEEIKHIEAMVEKLADKQLEGLVTSAGITFGSGSIERSEYEGVIDEIDREDFYKLYHRLVTEV